MTVVDYDRDYWQRHCVSTTEELLDKIKELSGHSITVSFWDDRHVTHPPMRRKERPLISAHCRNFMCCGQHRVFCETEQPKDLVCKVSKAAVSDDSEVQDREGGTGLFGQQSKFLFRIRI